MKNEDFNQKFDQITKKFKSTKLEIQKLYQANTIIDEIKINKLADTTSKIFSVGGGKEATVLLAEKDKRLVCVKYFYPNSSSNLKRSKQQYHVKTHEMASIMAKTEFQNLRILEYYGVNVPSPINYNKGLAFSMTMIPFQSNSLDPIPAPILKNVSLKEFMDPYNFLEEILDQIEIMFKKALMVHGDLSEFNILFSDKKPFIIDVSQSRLYNIKTHTKTPVRIKIDSALQIFMKDLQTILTHFEKKYRIKMDIEDIHEKMFTELPKFVKTKKIIENLYSAKNGSSKLLYMSEKDIYLHTSVELSRKDKKMLDKMKSLLYD